MTLIRRVLIGIVGLLLVLDCAALVLVKQGPRPSEEKSKLVIWIDDKEQAELAVETLKGMDYEPMLKAAKRDSFVKANYRLVYPGKRELLEPIANVLRKGGHTNLSFSEDGTILYYGGVYTQKAEAKRIAKSLEARERVIFEVQPGQKKVTVPSHRVILLEVPDNFIADITDALEAVPEIEVVETEETSLTPKEEVIDEETVEED